MFDVRGSLVYSTIRLHTGGQAALIKIISHRNTTIRIRVTSSVPWRQVMQRIMKKSVGLLTIGSIFLLPLILSEIQAQQTAAFPSTTARSAAISIEALRSRRLAIESMANIDDTVKTESLRYIDLAIKDLGLIDLKRRGETLTEAEFVELYKMIMDSQ